MSAWLNAVGTLGFMEPAAHEILCQVAKYMPMISFASDCAGSQKSHDHCAVTLVVTYLRCVEAAPVCNRAKNVVGKDLSHRLDLAFQGLAHHAL